VQRTPTVLALLSAAGLLALVSGAAFATPVTIYFADVPPADEESLFIVSNGYSFSYDDPFATGTTPFISGSYAACASCGAPVGFTFTTLSGNNFSLDSMFLEQWNLGGSGPSDVEIIGHLKNGGTVNENLTLSYFETRTLNFDGGWSKLDSVSVIVSGEAGSHAVYFDDIVTNVVPVPPAILFFSSALAALGWFRKHSLKSLFKPR